MAGLVPILQDAMRQMRRQPRPWRDVLYRAMAVTTQPGSARTEGRYPASHGSGAAAAGPPQAALEAGAREIGGGESWDEAPDAFHLSPRRGLEEWEPPRYVRPRHRSG
jgi:hypothetical protein